MHRTKVCYLAPARALKSSSEFAGALDDKGAIPTAAEYCDMTLGLRSPGVQARTSASTLDSMVLWTMAAVFASRRTARHSLLLS